MAVENERLLALRASAQAAIIASKARARELVAKGIAETESRLPWDPEPFTDTPRQRAIKDMAKAVYGVVDAFIAINKLDILPVTGSNNLANLFYGEGETAVRLKTTATTGKTIEEQRVKGAIGGIVVADVYLDPSIDEFGGNKIRTRSMVMTFAYGLGFLENTKGITAANPNVTLPPYGTPDYDRVVYILHPDKPFRAALCKNSPDRSFNRFVIVHEPR